MPRDAARSARSLIRDRTVPSRAAEFLAMLDESSGRQRTTPGGSRSAATTGISKRIRSPGTATTLARPPSRHPEPDRHRHRLGLPASHIEGSYGTPIHLPIRAESTVFARRLERPGTGRLAPLPRPTGQPSSAWLISRVVWAAVCGCVFAYAAYAITAPAIVLPRARTQAASSSPTASRNRSRTGGDMSE